MKKVDLSNYAAPVSFESTAFVFFGVLPRERDELYILDIMHLNISLQCAEYETPDGHRFPVVFMNYGKYFGRGNAAYSKLKSF